jgi:6,7-dimethyl-8-ribityllumazine synthase
LPELRGGLQGQRLRVAIVASHFNEFITSRLLNGARDGLLGCGVKEDDIFVAWVPGSFELPWAANVLAQQEHWDAIICLGVIIRGETSHFDLVAAESAHGIASVARNRNAPVIFGVLTTNNAEQALERAGGRKGNKGYDCALAAVEMANLGKALRAH